MKTTSLLALAALLFPAALPAQRLALGINDQPAGTGSGSMSGVYFAFNWQIPRPMVILAAEFWVGTTTGSCEVHIFDHDAANNRPGNLLGSGAFMPPLAKSWAGAMLDKPVIVTTPNTTLWLCLRATAGGTIAATGRSSTAPNYFHSTSIAQPIKWNGPYQGWDWMYRLYEAGGSGKTVFYGQGKNGSHGVPALDARGWPNLTNPLTLTAALLKGSSAGFLALGLRGDLPLPIGSVYVLPPMVTLGFATSGTTAQSVLFPLLVPGDSGLLGMSVAGQVWILDPGAQDGLAHTGGVQLIIG